VTRAQRRCNRMFERNDGQAIEGSGAVHDQIRIYRSVGSTQVMERQMAGQFSAQQQ
jgi:hypothetical protein